MSSFLNLSSPISFHGNRILSHGEYIPFDDHTSTQEEPELIGTAYAEERGMEYEIRKDADDTYILGACHEDVGLMRYWTSPSMNALTDFAEITDLLEEVLP